jgi:enamine deaminase RidA (YjgF/YER057c/UK114 family)
MMAGNRLYLSGFFGSDVARGKIPDDPAAQVQLAFDNMKQTLAAAGMDFRHVVFVNPYLTGKASSRMNSIYAKHFEFGNTPGRATIRVTSLPGGNTIEFTGVAIADLPKRLAARPKNMKPSPTASPCVFADDTYYCSAKGPFTPGPTGVQGVYASTVEAQVRQTMRNLLDGLEEAGLTLSNVVATNLNGAKRSQLLMHGSCNLLISWSGRPGSNRRHSAWEADVLPLNYSRSLTAPIYHTVSAPTTRPARPYWPVKYGRKSRNNSALISGLSRSGLVTTWALKLISLRGVAPFSLSTRSFTAS